MNILVTGANGFLAKEILDFFSDKDYKLFPTNRETLNMLKGDVVANFIEKNKIDAVLHTAVSGNGKKTDTYEDFCNNIIMFRNLYRNQHMFKMMINFGSGAEFDRKQDIKEKKEDAIFDSFPNDYYGLAKNLITREIIKSKNIYNFRIFGCFGKHEAEGRFIKNSIRRLDKQEPILIHKNKWMDYVYAKDVCLLIKYYLDNVAKKELHKDINVCYTDKRTLKDIAVEILTMRHMPSSFLHIEKPTHGFCYSGDATKVESTGLNFYGLKKGIYEAFND